MKIKITALFSALIITLIVLVAAQHPRDPEDMPRHREAPMQCPGMDGMMGRGMCPMHALQPGVIPTQDGGVLVIIGNRLIKYDSDLNQTQEVTVEMSREEMQSMIRQRAEMMEMCRELMEEMMPEEEEEENGMAPENHQHE